MSLSSTCQEVVVELQNSENELDPIIAGVGGGIGAIVGIVIGIVIVITKCFLLDLLKHCCCIREKNEATKNVKVEDIESRLDGKKGSGINDRNYEGIKKAQQSIHDDESEDGETNADPDDQEVSVVEKMNLHDVTLANVLSQKSFQMMVYEVSILKSKELFDVEMKSWKDRHTCIWLVFRMILIQQVKNKQLSKKKLPIILAKVEKNLADCLKMCKFQELQSRRTSHVITSTDDDVEDKIGKTILERHSLETLKILAGNYNTVCETFEEDVAECSSNVKSSEVREVIVEAIAEIEEGIRTLQQFKTQAITDIFHRILLVTQAYNSGNVALLELIKTRRKYCGVLLRRVSESDRLPEEECDSLWMNIKEALEEKYDQVVLEMESDMEKLQLQFAQRRKQARMRLDNLEKKAMHKFLDTDSQISQLVQNYFSVIVGLEQKKMSIFKELCDNEAAEVAQLQKRNKMSLGVEVEEVQAKIHDFISNNEALTRRESRLLLNQMEEKIKSADEQIALINRGQSLIMERELKSYQSYHCFDAETHNFDQISRSHILEGEAQDLNQFLSVQVYLAERDQARIIEEYKIFTILLNNHLDLTRIQIYHELDAELLRRQVNLLAEQRQEDRLKTSEDLEAIWERFSDLGSEHDAKFSCFYQAGCKSVLDLAETRKKFASGLIAGVSLKNLVKESENSHKETKQMKGIKDEFLQKLYKHQECMNAVEFQSLSNDHASAINAMETQLRKEHNIQCQVLEERMIAKTQIKLQQLQNLEAKQIETRPSSRLELSIGNVLDRLLEQSRNQRIREATESAGDVTTATRVYLQHLAFKDKLQSHFQDLDKNLLCKVAMLNHLKKSEVVECVQKGLARDNSSETDKKQLITDFSRRWATLRTSTSRVSKRPARSRLLEEETHKVEFSPHYAMQSSYDRRGRKTFLEPLESRVDFKNY